MIILQASAIGNTLSLWGETTTLQPPPNARSLKILPLPYAATVDALTDALQSAGVGMAPKKSAIGKLALWLPVTGDREPISSSPLIGGNFDAGDVVDTLPFEIRVIDLEPTDQIALLTLCVGRDSIAPGVFIGSTLRFWCAVMQFASALTVRQQYVPTLVKPYDDWEARWQPVIGGADSERLARLVRAMPGACYALSRVGDPEPLVHTQAVVTTQIGVLCDHLVRTSKGPELPRVRSLRSYTPVSDRWLNALRSNDGLVAGIREKHVVDDTADGECQKLSKQLAEWARPLSILATSPFRLCFRLVEPPAINISANDEEDETVTSATWKVEYLLQAAADPSLLVDANDVWKPKKGGSSVLAQPGFKPRDFLLMALGAASRIWPAIDETLADSAPTNALLDSRTALDFLAEYAPALEQAGFALLLPGWWTKKGTRSRLSARGHAKSPKMQAKGKLSLASVVEFDYEIALGDETLSRKQLEELARQKSSLVRIRGQWVQVDQAEIKAALDHLKKHADKTLTMADIMKMAIGGTPEVGGLPFEGIVADGWAKDFLDQLSGNTPFAEQPVPIAVDAQLRPYQRRGYSWMTFLNTWGLGACLADDMGLGKTIQVLTHIRNRWESGDHKPTLVICPTSVIGNWQREAARFVPDLQVMVHHGSSREKGVDFAKHAAENAIVLSSFALLHRDVELFRNASWGGIVLDEAQNIKNPETSQSKAARAIEAPNRVALTGTPVENHVGDLWSIMEFLNPGLLGTQADFKRRFFKPIQSGTSPEAVATLKRLTAPFILRRMKTDRTIIADLPEKNEMSVYCNLTKEQASLYEAVVRDVEDPLNELDGMERRGLILATLSKLKQICNHPAQFLHDSSPIPGRSGKLSRLTEMLEEALDVGDKALIFSQFHEMGEMMKRHLEESFGQEVLFLHGGTAKNNRDKMVERFQSQEPGAPRVFILSLKAGGTGLNLTAANHVFHYDRWWNPAVENQATDRAFRIGQTKAVQVHKFICGGTLEEKIDDMIQSKQQMASQVVGVGEDWLTELSTDALKSLFALGKDAVG